MFFNAKTGEFYNPALFGKKFWTIWNYASSTTECLSSEGTLIPLSQNCLPAIQTCYIFQSHKGRRSLSVFARLFPVALASMQTSLHPIFLSLVPLDMYFPGSDSDSLHHQNITNPHPNTFLNTTSPNSEDDNRNRKPSDDSWEAIYWNFLLPVLILVTGSLFNVICITVNYASGLNAENVAHVLFWVSLFGSAVSCVLHFAFEHTMIPGTRLRLCTSFPGVGHDRSVG